MGAELDTRTAIFVSGTQGAGKTTVASLLARRFARGVHVSADVLQKMIVSGGRWPEPSTTSRHDDRVAGEAGEQLRLRVSNMCLLGGSFYDAGFTVVLEDIIIGAGLDEVLEDLAGRPFYFVMLRPSLEVVREREIGRGTRLFAEWEWLDDVIERTPRVGMWLDTSRQAADETVDEIMRRAWDDALVTPATRVVA